MSVIVTDRGFAQDRDVPAYQPLDQIAANAPAGTLAIDLPSDADPEALASHISELTAVRIDFPSFANGRGFTLARRLREQGYTGPLRAKGHVLADQYAMARRSGFDEVEISDDLAARQPEDQWLARANWQAHNYQARLRG